MGPPPSPSSPPGWKDNSWMAAASHYDVLGLAFSASHEELKRAYRRAARRYHPDKGGSSAAFARIQAAWEVLGDAHRRAVYDSCSFNYLHQHIRQERQRASGGEAELLAELYMRCAAAADEANGSGGSSFPTFTVLPNCQLVVTCEICGRPATRDCSVCGMPFCSFCARRQHWRGSHPLHWPLVVAHGLMLERLGRKEMEAKRLEDDRRLALSDPHHRSEAQLRELRAFHESAALAAARPDHKGHFDPALARLYMWTQTERHVVVACYLPNGRHDREVQAELQAGGVLRLGVEGGLPVVHRVLAGPVDPAASVETLRTSDGLFALVVLMKAQQLAVEPGKLSREEDPRLPPTAWSWRGGTGTSGWWRQLFAGDSDGARSLPPPYVLTQLPDEVVLEVSLPWWVRGEDVQVEVGTRQLEVVVRGVGLRMRRHYWWNSSEAARRPMDYRPVVPELSSWTLVEDVASCVSPLAAGAACQKPNVPLGSQPAAAEATTAAVVGSIPGGTGRFRGRRCLTITLARPEPTEEERLYKKGVRQDNRQAARKSLYGPPAAQQQHSLGGRGGVRFFDEDEDTFGLEPLLQAATFRVRGGAWIVPPPWRHEEALAWRWIDREVDLPSTVQVHVTTLRALVSKDDFGTGAS